MNEDPSNWPGPIPRFMGLIIIGAYDNTVVATLEDLQTNDDENGEIQLSESLYGISIDHIYGVSGCEIVGEFPITLEIEFEGPPLETDQRLCVQAWPEFLRGLDGAWLAPQSQKLTVA